MSRLTSSTHLPSSTLPTLARALVAASVLALAGCPSSGSYTSPGTTPSSAPEVVGSSPPVSAPVPPPPARLTTVESDLISHLTMAMYVDNFETRRLAAEELGSIGPNARSAMPELIRCAAAPSSSDEPIASCAHSLILVADASDTHALAALVFDFQLPLEIKERALSALGDLGGLATPAIATIYLDACNRAQGASSAGAAAHLAETERLALANLSRSPASARTYLENPRHGECGVTGAAAVSVTASR